ncbi:MAG: GTPase ObgE, partial [Sphaerochaetaceae bacterium]|nr:GTPase ObgE [Sphaerochaetaceae bacterium]
DETYIDIASGNGGNGCVSFRREKFVPKGGPDGGDGGRGGDLVFVVKNNLRTLAHLKIVRTFRAENGRNGSGARCYGRNGNDMEVPVPPGTVIKDPQTGEIIKDLTGLDRFVFLKGGRGGLGNYHFRTSTRQAPKFAQSGEPGIEMRVGLELLVIADIGFVGYPNAGKSSLMNMLTNARSKVADYPFTTKIPQLGMMRYKDQDVVIADIPGIIDGASQGAGMGFKFLKHIARTGGLAYLVDMSDSQCLDKYEKLRQELGTYSQELLEKREVLIGTKLDEDGALDNFEKFKAKYCDKEVYGMSIYDDDTVLPIMKAFINMVGKEEVEKGFSTVLNTEAYYPEEDDRFKASEEN